MNPEKLKLQELSRLQRVKHAPRAPMNTIGPSMLSFFKHSVEKKQTKIQQIAQSWVQLVPESLCDHTALESFHGGTLKVLVDSSSHLYELKHLLLAGLEKQLLVACKRSGLRKIALKPGRWYVGEGADRRINFD
jgi:hypothetical protein